MPSVPTQVCDSVIRVRGTVQGVGFRPFVYRVAHELGLRGWVRNDNEGVLIRIVGAAAQRDALLTHLRTDAPPAARVTEIECAETTSEIAPVGEHFAIDQSDTTARPTCAAVPADLALCVDCRRELRDPSNRRHRYPFINCTQCGPRYSLIEELPYDRARTTMQRFTMCPECTREYHDPLDRRFHAEPNACPVCGPQLSLTDLAGNAFAARDDALHGAVTALRSGMIGAIKGVGGFHLMCDATNELAVAELRLRKHREEKPLAVMFADLAALRLHAHVSATAEAMLTSPTAPIVLVPRRRESSLAYSLAPGNPWIGALLPYSPIHVLLLQAMGRPLIATSANLAEEPICTDNHEARARLFGIADFHLAHDRPISRPVEDSVVRETVCGAPIILRRARGFAPSPLPLPGSLAEVHLCVGAQMKSTVAIAAGAQVICSPHLGDLGSADTQAVFEQTIATLTTLYGAQPTTVVHDKHPDYCSTHFAGRSGLIQLGVQHHLAHVLALLLEHQHPAHDVLGISWDGTGYGEDGTIWGGEFLLLENQRASRFARLRPFRLPGGEAAVRDARRVALALSRDADMGSFAEQAERLRFNTREQSVLHEMLAQGLNSPRCSSGGRLFDGVSALLNLCSRNQYEGQAPLTLEAAATRAPAASDVLPFEVGLADSPGAVLDLDWRPAIREILTRIQGPDELAAAFHRGLAQAMVATARHAGVGTVALTGGCFQNALLHALAATALRDAGFHVLTHRQLSPNDNSIAAGQALGALWGLTSVSLPS
ncbi:MAG: carbamoyltransferase HypF [Candidatus Didemnitutus sp.]|nr:carbamoyltransferase HypF [Candidatus Didemnitutus sp.]